MDNLYSTLGLDQQASDDDIKKAYRKLSLQYHPDKCRSEDGPEKFASIKRAMEVLSDPKKRQIYDRIGLRGVERYEEDLRARDSARIPKCEPTLVEVPVSLDQFFRPEDIPITFTVTNYDSATTEEKSIAIGISDLTYDRQIGIPDAGDTRSDMMNGDVIVKLVRPADDRWRDYEVSGYNIMYKLKLSLGDLLSGYDRVIKHPNGTKFRISGKYDEGTNVFIAEGLGLGSGDLIVHIELDIDMLLSSSEEFRAIVATSQHKKTVEPEALTDLPEFPGITIKQHRARRQRRFQMLHEVEGPQNGCVPQ